LLIRRPQKPVLLVERASQDELRLGATLSLEPMGPIPSGDSDAHAVEMNLPPLILSHGFELPLAAQPRQRRPHRNQEALLQEEHSQSLKVAGTRSARPGWPRSHWSHSSWAASKGMGLICCRTSLISNPSPGSRLSEVVWALPNSRLLLNSNLVVSLS